MATKFMAVVEDSYMTEADQRSKDHPGHGYPATRVTTQKVIEFENGDQVSYWIKREEGRSSKKSYRIFSCIELQASITLGVHLEELAKIVHSEC